jgi:putative nucleotidyltransferase with HDIG domain
MGGKQMEAAAIDNKVKQVISNINNLPTPPIVFNQIQKALSEENVSAVQVASILSEDPAISAKVLKLTNSAFYGLTREVETVRQAVVIIGMEAVRNLVLSASVLDMFNSDVVDRYYQDQFWRHSLAVASASRLVARNANAGEIIDVDSSFSAGLLHDIGKIVIACYLPEQFKQLVDWRSQTDNTTSDYDLEEMVFGYNHAQIGGFLGTHWRLPTKLQYAIIFHHEPGKCPVELLAPFVVHVGNFIAKKSFFDDEESLFTDKLEEGALERLGIEEDMIPALCEKLKEEYLKAETFMQIAGT